MVQHLVRSPLELEFAPACRLAALKLWLVALVSAVLPDGRRKRWDLAKDVQLLDLIQPAAHDALLRKFGSRRFGPAAASRHHQSGGSKQDDQSQSWILDRDHSVLCKPLEMMYIATS